MRVYSTSDLRSRGFGKRRVADLVADGSLVRVRQGRYVDATASAELIRAVRIGGILGCVSALVTCGVWVSRRSDVHVHVAPNASRLRSGGVRHWGPLRCGHDLARVDVLDALLTAMLCQGLIDAVASVDSALHLGLVRMSDLRAHCTDARRRRVLDLADARSESGLETILRVALTLVGLRVEIQVRISAGRVDLLVEGCLVVEADGAAFHGGARRHQDYVRDTTTVLDGLGPLRFDGAQILGDLATVVLCIIAAVRQRRGAPISGREAEAARIRVERLLSA